MRPDTRFVNSVRRTPAPPDSTHTAPFRKGTSRDRPAGPPNSHGRSRNSPAGLYPIGKRRSRNRSASPHPIRKGESRGCTAGSHPTAKKKREPAGSHQSARKQSGTALFFHTRLHSQRGPADPHSDRECGGPLDTVLSRMLSRPSVGTTTAGINSRGNYTTVVSPVWVPRRCRSPTTGAGSQMFGHTVRGVAPT